MTRTLRSFRSLTALWLLLLSLLSLLAASCGDSRFKPVYPVKGQVLVDGKPAAGVTVRLHSLDDPNDQLVSPNGFTDEEGWFTLTTYKVNDGAPTGSYAVTLRWLPSQHFVGNIVKANKLPRSYDKAETSRIKVQITKGENILPPFELTAKK